MNSTKANDEIGDSTCLEGEELGATRERLLNLGIATPEILHSDFHLTEVTASGDVFIQAGHLNTPDDKTGASASWGNEIDWTPVVTNRATQLLRQAGIAVIKEDASIKNTNKRFEVKLAVFIHFDGSTNPAADGASVGYNDSSDSPAAQEWKQLYSKYWPFGWNEDNYTNDLRNYYGFEHTITQDAEVVLELGMLTNFTEGTWLKPRLEWLGSLVAHFLSKRIGMGGVPDPGAF
jgi:hypothetical protein